MFLEAVQQKICFQTGKSGERKTCQQPPHVYAEWLMLKVKKENSDATTWDKRPRSPLHRIRFRQSERRAGVAAPLNPFANSLLIDGRSRKRQKQRDKVLAGKGAAPVKPDRILSSYKIHDRSYEFLIY